MPAPTLFAPNGQPLLHIAALETSPGEAQVNVGSLELHRETAPDGTPRMRIGPIHSRHIPFSVAFLGGVDNDYVETLIRLRDDYGTRLVYKIIGFSREHGLLVGELQDPKTPLRVVPNVGVEGDNDAS